MIQVVLIAESPRLQQTLATYGIQSQTPHQIEPIQVQTSIDNRTTIELLFYSHAFTLQAPPLLDINIRKALFYSSGLSRPFRVQNYLKRCVSTVGNITDLPHPYHPEILRIFGNWTTFITSITSTMYALGGLPNVTCKIGLEWSKAGASAECFFAFGSGKHFFLHE